MWQLFQFPLCPFSRKVRLMLGEKGVGYELVRESPWMRRDEFLHLNPAGQTPVIVQGQVAFDEKLFGEVVSPLMEERMLKRLVHRTSPDAKMIRDAMRQANAHLDYIDWLLDHRRWLGGPVLSLADLAAAAHLSVADYLGGIDWRGHEQTKQWYAGLKSRPSFRPMLSERMEVIGPPAHYDKVDFWE